MRKVLSLVLSLAMLLQVCFCSLSFAEETGTTVTVVSADGTENTYTLNDGDNVRAWEEGSTVTVEGDINSQNYGASAGNDASLTVNGNIDAQYNGLVAHDESTATVNGDITGGHEGVDAFGESTVTVNGDVTGEFSGVYASEKTTVAVNGDITAGNNGVSALEESTVTVNGDITSEYNGVSAHGESTATVNGDITAEYNGVYANDQAEVTVTGDINAAGEDTYTDEDGEEHTEKTGNGIYVEDETTVTVDGDIKANQSGVSAMGDAVVTVNGDIEAGTTQDNGEGHMYNVGAGVFAGGNASVTVNGDITSLGSGIEAGDSSTYEEEYSEDGSTVTATQTNTADGAPTVTVTGDVTADGNGIYISNNGTITVEGNVTSSEENGITAIGFGTNSTDVVTYDVDWTETDRTSTSEEVETSPTVTVGGDVTGANTGIYADGGVTVDVAGNVSAEDTGITAYHGAEVTVGGNVSAQYNGILAFDEAEVTVEGNIESEDSSAIYMLDGSSVTVWGDVTGGDITYEESASESEETYTPTAEEAALEAAYDEAFGEYVPGAVMISPDEGTENGSLIVGGTITAQGESAPIVVNIYTADPDNIDLSNLPDIKVYEVEENNGTHFDVNVMTDQEIKYTYEDESGTQHEESTMAYGNVKLSEEDHSALVEAIAAAVQYIIKVENPDNGSISLSGTTYDAENDLQLAHEGDYVAVNVKPDNGYVVKDVSAGEIAELINNGDGTWTVIVRRGGGVTIRAIIRRNEDLPHEKVGSTILYGHYDLDGDGVAEDLAWRCTKVSHGYAKLALITGLDETPEDFSTAFTEEEMAGIKDGEITELDEAIVAKMFKDGKVHPVIHVKLALIYQ